MMNFHATGLYPSAMWDKTSVFPKIESGFAFKPHMNVVYVKTFNNQSFNQDGNESSFLKINYYNPPDLIFQHLPIKEKVGNTEVILMRNGYILDVSSSVDIQEVVRTGGKVIKIYEGVVYRENFETSPFRKFIKKTVSLKGKNIKTKVMI